MLFDVVERVYTVTNTNFATDYTALLSAKSVTAPGGSVVIAKRMRSETHKKWNGDPPYLNIRGLRAQTNAKDQGKRDSLCEVEWEFYLEGTDPSLIARQAELAAEAVCKTIDLLAASGDGLFGGGEERLSVTVEMSEAGVEGKEDLFWHSATVRAPVWDRDEGV